MTGQNWAFASDNCSGAHPAVLEAIAAANAGAAAPYGDDDVTAGAIDLLRRAFGERSRAALVFNGTAANVLAIRVLLGVHEAVIAAASAHLSVDEGGAPERFLGAKLYTVPTADGKLSPADVDVEALGTRDVHRAQPGVLSIAQPTELGTVYTQDELRALIEHAHRQGLRVHVDGARLANAAAALRTSLAGVSGDLGADAVSFGGTKNGLLCGEAVVVFGDEHARALRYVQKQGMQLASKMRFVAAQFAALLGEDLWRSNAAHANRLTRQLADGVAPATGLSLAQAVETNAVFAVLPEHAAERLRRGYAFSTWARPSTVRWMTSWATTSAEVDDFVAAVHEAHGV